MKSIVRTLALAAALAFAAVPAQARDFKDLDWQWYVGAGLGLFSLDTGAGSDTVFGGYGALGADVTENFGAELRLGTTGTATVPAFGFTVNYGIDYFLSFLGKAQLPLADNDLRVYAVLGFTYAKATATVTSPVPIPGATASGSDTSFTFGFGADYRFLDNMTGGAEWVAYNSNVSGFVATLKYEF